MKRFTNMLKNERGFTLIELLVVIAIIGILATIVIINVSSARNKANDARIQSDLQAMTNGVELYLSDGGSLTTMSGTCGDDGIISNATGVICSGSVFKKGTTTYIGKLPDHPTVPGSYTWLVSGSAYTIQSPLVTDAAKKFVCANGSCQIQ